MSENYNERGHELAEAQGRLSAIAAGIDSEAERIQRCHVLIKDRDQVAQMTESQLMLLMAGTFADMPALLALVGQVRELAEGVREDE